MYKLLTTLYLLFLSAALAAPLVFNKDTHKDYRVAHFMYYGYKHATYGTMRMAYFVPKLGYTWTDGFKTVHNGMEKVFNAPVLGNDDYLNSMLALTDCKNWYALVYYVYNTYTGAEYRPYMYKKLTNGDFETVTVNTLAALGELLNATLYVDLYKGLVEKGVPAHPLTLYLRKYYY